MTADHIMTTGAKRVAVELARAVRYPGILPFGNPLRFDAARIGLPGADGYSSWACPQGLHPDARPYTNNGHWSPCGLLFGADGDEFAEWWDAQRDPREACLVIWGDKVYGEGFVTRGGKGKLDPKWKKDA